MHHFNLGIRGDCCFLEKKGRVVIWICIKSYQMLNLGLYFICFLTMRVYSVHKSFHCVCDVQIRYGL